MDSGHLVKANASALREVTPASPLDYCSSGHPFQPWLPHQESALREYLRVLIKRKWTIIGCVATMDR
jgi:hypothetical protein